MRSLAEDVEQRQEHLESRDKKGPGRIPVISKCRYRESDRMAAGKWERSSEDPWLSGSWFLLWCGDTYTVLEVYPSDHRACGGTAGPFLLLPQIQGKQTSLPAIVSSLLRSEWGQLRHEWFSVPGPTNGTRWDYWSELADPRSKSCNPCPSHDWPSSCCKLHFHGLIWGWVLGTEREPKCSLFSPPAHYHHTITAWTFLSTSLHSLLARSGSGPELM